jgi:hypothetical protein
LSFLDSGGGITAVRLRKGSPWYLSLYQRVNTIRVRQEFILQTIQYAYRIQKAATDEALVRFEYESRETEPDFAYARNHVQFHADFDGVIHNFSPSKLHIPTGWVTIENVVRFLFADLKLKPLRANWETILAQSEEQFRDWTDRTVH